MLRAHSIHRSYGQLDILKGVDLEVKKGEIVTILGASGAGKSTLLNILGTLDKPGSGYVEIGNTNVSALNNKDLSVFRNRRIGFVFQFQHQQTKKNALENVCIPALIAGESRNHAEK